MARHKVRINAPVSVVFATLSDPRPYARFVVGTKRVRWFDPSWPDPGTSIHHTVGLGPFKLRDLTSVVTVDPPHRLVLRPYVRPLAILDTVFTLTDEGNDQTDVELVERPVGGAAGKVPRVMDWMIWLRNFEVMRRFRKIAEQRARLASSGSEVT